MVLHLEVKTQNHWRNLTSTPKIQPNSILKILKEAVVNYKSLNYSCIYMPRLLFGSKEDNNGNDDSKQQPGRFSPIPAPFDANKFEAVRWKYHSNCDNDIKLNGKPKVILDLSGLPPLSAFLKKGSLV
jgi:hypothetical protein